MTVSKIPTNNILTLDIDAFMLKAKAVIHELFQNKSILTVPDHKKEAANDQDYITKPLTPLYAWAGGKRRLIAAYKPYLPDFSKLKHYVEPFFGAGAMFCEVFNNHRDSVKSYHLNDINKELVAVLKAIKSDCAGFSIELSELEQTYQSKSKVDRRDFYYELRNKYRALPAVELFTSRGSAMLYFLIFRMFQGIYKSKGGRIFTTYQQNKKIDFQNIKNWSVALRKAVITCGSYQSVGVSNDTFLFCDPPYRECILKYDAPFDDKEQRKCFEWVREKAEVNNTTAFLCNKDLNDSFFKEPEPSSMSKFVRFDYTHNTLRIGGKKKVVELLMIFKSDKKKQTMLAA